MQLSYRGGVTNFQMNIHRNVYYNFILRLSLNLLFILTAAFCFNYSTAQAALDTVPIDWDEFTFFELNLNGIPLRDVETAADPTHGPAAVLPDQTDIASGYDGTNGAAANCNPNHAPLDQCGLETSAWWAYYEHPTDSTLDRVAFRMRLNADPTAMGGGVISFSSFHWNFLIDIDGDRWKEFWVDLDGSTQGVPGNPDELTILYNNDPTQLCEGALCFIVNVFTACVFTMDEPGPDADCVFSHSRVLPVTDIFPADTTGEFFVDVQIPLFAFVDDTGMQVVFPDTPLGLFFSTSASNTDPLQKDYILECQDTAGNTDPTQPCITTDVTPVTLSYFRAIQQGSGIKFEWSTATETGNAGFNLYAETEDGRKLINDEIIPSKSVDSLSPLDYTYQSSNHEGYTYHIADIDLNGKEKIHGNFKLDKEYGQKTVGEKIDWATINIEHEYKNEKLQSIKKNKCS